MRGYDDRFSRQYGFWRPYIEKVIYHYLDCGDLRQGFARAKCKDCGHTLKGTREYLLAFSRKHRHFCPSCHQKRVVQFGEWICMDVLYPKGHAKKTPHRHFIFSIPKILRRYFLYDRKLLACLSRCPWESLKVFMQQAVPEKQLVPGAVIAFQTFGDFLRFNVFCGNRISPNDETAMENLARYIIRASFSQVRMKYLDQDGKVIYTAKDNKTSKCFPALEWLAAMCTHIPNRGTMAITAMSRGENVRRKAVLTLSPIQTHTDTIYGDPEYTWDEYTQS